MELLSPIGSKIDFGRTYFWSSNMVLRYYPEIHFYTHFWNSNSEKKLLDTKKFHFRRLIFIKSTLFFVIKILNSRYYQINLKDFRHQWLNSDKRKDKCPTTADKCWFFHLDPGCLTFSEGRIEVSIDKAFAQIVVRRINGKDGKVGCFWNTMEITAKAGVHFVDTKDCSP